MNNLLLMLLWRKKRKSSVVIKCFRARYVTDHIYRQETGDEYAEFILYDIPERIKEEILNDMPRGLKEHTANDKHVFYIRDREDIESFKEEAKNKNWKLEIRDLGENEEFHVKESGMKRN